MPDKTDLFYMPLRIEDLWRSTMAWGSDAQLVYRLLLEVHWLQRGILPKKLSLLKRLCRLDAWSVGRFKKAFDVIQGEDSWEKAKFKEDEFGLYNGRGREILQEVWEPRVLGHKGNLNQWGCKTCRKAGNPIDLGDGWIRMCPSCDEDLWSQFEEIPWLVDLVPAKAPTEAPLPLKGKTPTSKTGRGQGGQPKPKLKPKPKKEEEASEGNDASNSSEAGFCLAIEAVVGEVLDSARLFSPKESAMVMELFGEGIPAEVAVRTIRDVARRHKASHPKDPLKSVSYFISGTNGGAIREAWSQIKKLQDATASDDVVHKAAAPIAPSRSWDSIRSKLKKDVSDEEFETWFAHLPVAEATAKRVVLRCPSEAILGILQSDFKAPLDKARGSVCVDFVT